ncbi:MAG: glycosyltransferase family 4 protein, partial [Promethearchaeota archaeon]
IYLAKKYQIDYIYITDFWGVIAFFLKKIFRIPYVYVLNGYNPICPRGILFHKRLCEGFGVMKCLKNCHVFSPKFFFSFIITRLLLSAAQPVIAISKAVRNAYLFFFRKIPIKLFYYGIDTQKFKPIDINPAILKYNIGVSDKFILFFGRLMKERGIIEFLLHFNELLEKIDCKFLIVGLGPEVMEIKAKINALGLQKNVIFTGVLRNQELINMINLAHVIILPILFPEPLSLVVLEAMACGKTVISFELGGVKELLDDIKTGLLIPPNDWSQFINKLHQLMKNNELRTSIGNAARQKVEKYFNWDQFINKFLKELIEN